MHRSTPPKAGWHPTHLLLVLATWLATVGNWPLWIGLHDSLPPQGLHNPLILMAWGLALLAFTMAFLAACVWPRWLKATGWILLLMSASANYFMHRYHAVIDPTMMANAMHTDRREVRDLLSLDMVLFLLVGVILPGAWWLRQRIRPVPWGRLVFQQGVWVVMGLLVTTALLWLTFQDLASTMRNHKPVRYMINPFNTMYALANNALDRASQAQQTLHLVGQDAVLTAVPEQPTMAPLIVLIIGETARSDNFGLNGYERETTPRLSHLQQQGELVYFSQVSSCGTNTQVSVPCMFSDQDRDAYDGRQKRENVLDVIQRAGLATLWIDNQSGCKGVCDRMPSFSTQSLRIHGLCDNDECYDEVMLHVLPEQLERLPISSRRNGTLVVMHQMGSHGPAYFKRTPVNFKRFLPECQQTDLQACSREALINAYDNSVRYTDHVVAETIHWLQGQSRPVMLIYLSDHGESLGENGLFLHGLPYRMAPEQQTHVPMLIWTNQHMRDFTRLDWPCLMSRAQQPASHDHLFHTLLGLTQVSTQAYQPSLDLSAGCRRDQVSGSSAEPPPPPRRLDTTSS